MVSEENTENTHVLSKPILYPIEISVRLDWSSLTMLDRIAMYEREKRATMARRILIEKIQTYERNPSFKRFLKALEEEKRKKGKRGN